MLDTFIEIYATDNLELLGDGSDLQRQEAWRKIISQYEESTSGKDAVIKLGKVVDIMSVQNKVKRGKALLLLLKSKPNDADIAMMYEFMYMLPALNSDKSNLYQIVSSFENQLKVDDAGIRLMVDEYNELTKNKSGKQQNRATRDDFMAMVVAMSTHFKVPINEREITLEKYCSYVRAFFADVDRIVNQKNKLKS